MRDSTQRHKGTKAQREEEMLHSGFLSLRAFVSSCLCVESRKSSWAMRLLVLLVFCLILPLQGAEDVFSVEGMQTVPVAWKGRIRPLDVYSKLWVHEKFGKQAAGGLSPESVMWRLHFFHSGVPASIVFEGLSEGQVKQLVDLQGTVERQELFMMLPDWQGNWMPLHLLQDPHLRNITRYSDAQFLAIQASYNAVRAALMQRDYGLVHQELASLADALQQAYGNLAGTVMVEAEGKQLTYPVQAQLWGESIYYKFPFVPIAIVGYMVAVVLLLIAIGGKNPFCSKAALGALVVAFVLHTAILAMRWGILARPPVSNMFETVLYVPWVAVLLGFVLRGIYRSDLLLLASSLASVALLILLQVTKMSSSMEVVQAVLDSQYWLIVHVLMVVGSYGVFILGGVLGHLYLISAWRQGRRGNSEEGLALIGNSIVQTTYIGTAMLICGTILGGVWAAQSWGRFWDWDPKESWAFISSCIYLVTIHAYRFRYIGHFGLAVGAIIGLQAISFTWYGVNYILGTGLHSYGFGSGGAGWYYLFIAAEAVFLAAVTLNVSGLKDKRQGH